MFKNSIDVVVAGMAIFMFSVDTTAVAVGLTSISDGLDANFIWAIWTLTAFQLFNTVSMPLLGRISDAFGRKTPFLVCLMIFTLSSFLAALSRSIVLLIFLRIIMGAAAGIFQPSAVGLIKDGHPKNRVQLIGFVQAMFPVGGILTPIVAGTLLYLNPFDLGWRYIFLINVPIGLVTTFLGLLFLKGQDVQEKISLDIFGAIYFTLGILGLMVLFSALGLLVKEEISVPIQFMVALTVTSFLFIGLFVYRELTVADPIFDVHLIKQGPFLAANIYNFFFGAGHFGLFSFIPRFAFLAYAMNEMQSSLILLPRTIPMLVFSLLASIYIVRTGFRIPLISGLILVGGGLLLMSFKVESVTIFSSELSNFVLLGFPLMLTGIGMGMSSVASTNVALDLMPDKVAEITGLRGMFRNTGAVIGVTCAIFLSSLFDSEAVGLMKVFLFLGVITILLIPTVFKMPNRPLPNN